jgi:preprotein translocase subunit SecG
MCMRCQDGQNVLRRSTRFCVGLFTYLVIELIIIRRAKTSVGITRRREIKEVQRSQLLLSMSALTEYSSSMQELSHAALYTGDQNQQTTESRWKSDRHDTSIILHLFIYRGKMQMKYV